MSDVNNRESQLQGGTLLFDGPQQLEEPSPIILATNSGAGEAGLTTTVKVPVPSSQTRVKVSIVFYPTSGVLGDITGFGTVWVSAAEEDKKGIAGSGGRLVPVTDIEGTSTGPTSIPASSGLGGYSREFVTSAKWLQVVIQLSSMATPGVWVLQASLQPEGVIFPWPLWDKLRRLFIPQLAGPTGSL